MAIIDIDPLFDPIRGKILGTVFQTGRNTPVVKTKQSGQGQQLRNVQLSKTSLQHASTLWRNLSPADQAAWNAATVHFPTVDRYGNPVDSLPFQLFMRAVAPLPIFKQDSLVVPGTVFTGPLPSAPALTWDGSTLTFQAMPAPSGQNLNAALYCTRPMQPSIFYAKPSFRLVRFLDDYSGPNVGDVTALYQQQFGSIPLGTQIFWCVNTWKEGTPELINHTCGSVDIPLIFTPSPVLVHTFQNYTSAVTAQITFIHNRFYIGMSDQLVYVDADFITESISPPNPNNKPVIQTGFGLNAIASYSGQVVFTTQRFPGSVAGVHLYLYDGSTWTLLHNYGTGTNQVRYMGMYNNADFAICVSEQARVYDPSFGLVFNRGVFGYNSLWSTTFGDRRLRSNLTQDLEEWIPPNWVPIPTPLPCIDFQADGSRAFVRRTADNTVWQTDGNTFTLVADGATISRAGRRSYLCYYNNSLLIVDDTRRLWYLNLPGTTWQLVTTFPANTLNFGFCVGPSGKLFLHVTRSSPNPSQLWQLSP